MLPSLYALGSSTSVFSTAGDAGTLFDPGSELEPFLVDIARRFDKDGLEDVLGGVVRLVAFSPGLAGGMVSFLNSASPPNRPMLVASLGTLYSNSTPESRTHILEIFRVCPPVLILN